MTDDAMAIPADPCPDLPIERGPEGKGIGSWVPQDKHRFLSYYLNGSRYAWRKWPQRVFIDPFCGPGRVQVKGEAFTRDGGAVVAWRQMVASGAPFTKVLIGDLDADRVDACAARLRACGAAVEAFAGPAVDTVPQMLSHVPSGALCFAYVDPYNLQYLSFSIIEALARLKVDIAVHFSTMDLLRNVDHELDPDRARFDDAAPGWRDDPAVQTTNRHNLPDVFFRYWMTKVEALGFECSRAMPLITNDANHGIYRMVFFARHDLPIRVWGDVARGNNGELF